MRHILMILIILISFSKHSNSSIKIDIKYKIDNEIITNLDILNEKKYLIFLRPNLKNLSEIEISSIAENSIVREKLKNKELEYLKMKKTSNL